MSTNLDKIYESILSLTQECGKLIKQRIWCAKTVATKANIIDFVTETDTEVEQKLIDGLLAEYPDHRFIGEEATSAGVKPELTSAPTWIIDPLDGTTNFVHGFPNVCISVGLLINKVAEIGIIYNPVLEQMFTARRGQGAYLNGNRIHVSTTQELSKSLVQLEVGTSREKKMRLEVLHHNFNVLSGKAQGLRASGSSAWNMAMVGLGAADAYVEFGLHAWDMAAGDLIVREAGGIVMDPAGGPFDIMSCRLLCSGTETLARQLVAVLTQYYPPRDA